MSNRINDGGPAFPQASPDMVIPGQTERETQGMTLRDWFAGMAINAELVTNSMSSENMKAFAEACTKKGHTVAQHLAHNCYELADAMLAARKKGGDK